MSRSYHPHAIPVGAYTPYLGPAPLPPTPRIPTVMLPASPHPQMPSPPLTPRVHPHLAPPSAHYPRATLPSPQQSHRAYPSPAPSPSGTFQLHASLLFSPMLGREPACNWNVLQPVAHATFGPTRHPQEVLMRDASNPQLTQVRIVSAYLPRGASVAVRGTGHHGTIIVRDILSAVAELVGTPLSAVELASLPQAMQMSVRDRAARRRDAVARRVDCISSSATQFLGLSTSPHSAHTFEVHFG